MFLMDTFWLSLKHGFGGCGHGSADETDLTYTVYSTDSVDLADSTDSPDSTDLADSYFNPHLDRLGYF